MIELDIKSADITKKLNDDYNITFTVDRQNKGNIEALNDLLGQASPITLKIDKKRKKRSLNANAYYHVLLNELASVLKTSQEELHIVMLKRYGQIAIDENGNKMIVSVQSNIDFSKYYKYVEIIGKATLQDKEFTHYKCLKGSSEMDTREFSILLDGLISECKEQKIQTMTPQELESLQGYERR